MDVNVNLSCYWIYQKCFLDLLSRKQEQKPVDTILEQELLIQHTMS